MIRTGALLERIHAALRNPAWPLALGRKSYVPSESIWIEKGLQDAPLEEALTAVPLDRGAAAGGKIPARAFSVL